MKILSIAVIALAVASCSFAADPLVQLFPCERRTCVVVNSQDAIADYAEVQLLYKTWIQGTNTAMQVTLRKVSAGLIINGVSMILPDVDVDIQEIIKIQVTLYRGIAAFEIDPAQAILRSK